MLNASSGEHFVYFKLCFYILDKKRNAIELHLPTKYIATGKYG